MQFEISSFSNLDFSKPNSQKDNGEKLVQLLLDEDDQETISTTSCCSEIRSNDSMENLAALSHQENSFSCLSHNIQMISNKNPRGHSKSTDDSNLVKIGVEIRHFASTENHSDSSVSYESSSTNVKKTQTQVLSSQASAFEVNELLMVPCDNLCQPCHHRKFFQIILIQNC